MIDLCFFLRRRDFYYFLFSKITFKVLLYFFILTSVIYGNSLFTNQIPLAFVFSVYWFFFFSILFFGLIQFITYDEFNLKIRKNFFWYILYPITAILSFLVNFNTVSELSIHKIRTFLMPWLIGLVILQVFNYKDVKKVPILFLIFALINLILVYISYVSESTIILNDGLFSDRNQIARFFSIVNVFLLITFFNTNSKLNKLLIIPLLFLILISITFFFSRAGYLLYVSSTAFVLWSTKIKSVRRIMFLAFPILIIVFALMTSIRIKRERMNVSNASDLGRISLLKGALNMIADKPILGVGYGMSNDKFTDYEDKNFPGITSTQTIHNSFIVVFAEQGIVGFLAYLFLNFSVMYDLFRIIRYRKIFKKYTMELFFISALGLYLIHGLVNPTFDYVIPYWIIITSSMIIISNNTDVFNNKQTLNLLKRR